MAQPYVGEIRLFAGNFAPAGWMFCEGQLLPISENETLFQLIGTTYGGDGMETFNLPNLSGRIPIHMGTGPDGTTYQIGEMAGTEQETLTVQQIPSHVHRLSAGSMLVYGANPGTTELPAGKYPAPSPGNLLYSRNPGAGGVMGLPIGADKNKVFAPTGGSQPHTNMQPYTCVNFIISLFGIFPSPT